MPRVALKPDTRKVYEFIREYIQHRGLPPTQREIADHCFVARSSIQRHLDILDALGFIIREPGTARGITLGEKELTSTSE